MKIGILYIAVNQYTVFWPQFYSSCNENFCPDTNKHYYVFTNNLVFFDKNKLDNVSVYFTEDLGWPGNTLFRFRMFLNIKNELINNDYLFFLNSNFEVLKPIYKEMILPNEDENYFTALSWHKFKNSTIDKYPYDRNQLSTAYINKNEGKFYFQGGFNGGRTKEYIRFMEVCFTNIEIDLKKNVIAKAHDESHLNKYLLNKHVKILSTEFGKPEEWGIATTDYAIFRDKKKYISANEISKMKYTFFERNYRKLILLLSNFKKILTHSKS